jgi:GntR family transcriptional regulator, transcriptional repressor for pyruvate dehydrogenase complex
VHNGLDLGATVLGAARSRHAFEDCVERLATAIRLGVYPDGSTLPPERELSVRMGVSRATLREAIAALRTADLVRTTRGRAGGTVVDYPPVTPGEDGAATITTSRPVLMDSLVYRRIVEPGACYLAASRSLDEEERTLLTDAHADVIESSSPAEHRQADSRLHLAIASLTGSYQLVDAVTSVQSHLHEMLIAIPSLPVNITHSSRQHADIVAAILKGNAKRARATMENHCDDTAALLRGLLG